MKHHKHILQEVAKVATGLVIADFIVGIWVESTHTIPLMFSGLQFTEPMVLGWMIFDLILIIILIHYAWHADIHTPSLTQKTVFVLVGIITGIIGIAHLLRLIFNISIDIGGFAAPFWLSWIAVIVALYISYISFHFAICSKRRK